MSASPRSGRRKSSMSSERAQRSAPSAHLIAVELAPALGLCLLEEPLRRGERWDTRLPARRLQAAVWAQPDEAITVLHRAIGVEVAAPLQAQLPLAVVLGGRLVDDLDACLRLRHGAIP